MRHSKLLYKSTSGKKTVIKKIIHEKKEEKKKEVCLLIFLYQSFLIEFISKVHVKLLFAHVTLKKNSSIYAVVDDSVNEQSHQTSYIL